MQLGSIMRWSKRAQYWLQQMVWVEHGTDLHLQKTPHTLPSQASYGESIVRISENINHDLTHWPLGDLNENFQANCSDYSISCEIALRWMPLTLTDDKSTLVQVMAWCHQATSHCLSQCWPRSLSPYGVTRPQWVKGTESKLSSSDTYFILLLYITFCYHDIYYSKSLPKPVLSYCPSDFRNIPWLHCC